jgi:hypothetical protein
MMDLSEESISTKHNPSSFLVEMIIRSRSGHTKLADACLPSMDILTMSARYFFIMSYLGLFQVPMIRQSEFGIGRTDLSVSSGNAILIISLWLLICAKQSAP